MTDGPRRPVLTIRAGSSELPPFDDGGDRDATPEAHFDVFWGQPGFASLPPPVRLVWNVSSGR